MFIIIETIEFKRRIIIYNCIELEKLKSILNLVIIYKLYNKGT